MDIDLFGRYFGRATKVEPLRSPIKKGNMSPSKNESPSTPNRKLSPVKKIEQNERWAELSPSPKKTDVLNTTVFLPESPAKPTVTLINDSSPSTADDSNNTEAVSQTDFFSTLARKVQQAKSPQKQRNTNLKAAKEASKPKLGTETKKQGLLACYGFIPRPKLQRI